MVSRVNRATVGVVMLAIACWCQAATTFTYDALGRLTQAVYSSGATITYAYDALGNRTSQTITGVPAISVVSGSPQLAPLNTAFDQPLTTEMAGTPVIVCDVRLPRASLA